MKKTIFIASLALIVASCTSGPETNNIEERKTNFAEMLDKPTVIEFEEMAFDFGTVKDGEQVNHVFKFKNTGSETLVLLDVKGSCGCTVPVWPRNPILPGESGEIDVTFDSENRVGKVRKTVRIQANTEPSKTTLEITGEVIERN
ncbi:MAG: DUF1573 domain-containing protein [Putridiphycobacter sp.]|nr:DUF1573 domain-containing protein [Putridiphycobacter sp.]